MNNITRQTGMVLAIALLLSACGGSKPEAGGAAPPATSAAGTSAVQTDAEKVVNVYNWSDYIDPKVIDDFQKQTGIKVNYDVFDSNEVLETKLLTGNSGYDVVVPSAYFLERQVKAGVFAKLDRSRLPNLENLDPEIAAQAARHDPGGEHSVVYMWGTTAIGYDAAKVKAILPDAPVDSWRLVFDPAIVARFAGCGVSVLDDPTDIVSTVLLYLGKDPNSESEADLAAAEAVLMKIRPYLRTIHSSQYIDQLANGELCIAVGYSGRHPAGPRPRGGGGQAGRYPVLDPARGRPDLVRHAGRAGRCGARGQRACVHRLPAASGGCRRELRLRQLRECQCRGHSAGQ
jgi:putrescine transport system substrate-binding protein